MPDPRPIGRPKPEPPIVCAVPEGTVNLLDPAVIAEEGADGEAQNAAKEDNTDDDS